MEDEIFDETKIDDETEKEYEYLLFLFEQLLDKFDNQTIDLEEFQDIVEARNWSWLYVAQRLFDVVRI